jgi:hypothetical protein
MTETYYTAAYWGPRQESAEACAKRAQAFFEAMAQCAPHFARWFGPPPSRKKAPSPLDLEVPTLERMFAQDRVRNDEGGIIEDLGFRISADNGMWPGTRQREFSRIGVKCGGYADSMGPNSCVLNLPSAGDAREQVIRAPVLASVIRAMILAWEPEWGVATSHAHLDLLSEPAIVGTFVGWIMYFPRQLGPVPSLPSPVEVEPIEGRGSIVILTPERFTASNPEHVALAARVHNVLSQAGLLKPLF